MEAQRLLQTKEYAQMRRCSARTIERERMKGNGCRYIKIGRLVLYRLDDVVAFIEGHLRQNTNEADT